MAKPGNGQPPTREWDRRPASADRYVLSLYITGMTSRAVRAIENVRRVCETHLEGRYDLQIIDVYLQPGLARAAQIVAAPTLIKLLPLPSCRMIGDMSRGD